MKKALKFSGLFAAILAIVSFILLMATPAVWAKGLFDGTYELAGSAAIFGKSQDLSIAEAAAFTNKDLVIPASWSAIIAWILILVSMVILLLGVILPVLKVKALDKVAGLLNLIAVCALVVAGVFAFIEVPVFLAAAGRGDLAESYGLGAGWVIAGILAIVAGVSALLPAVSDFLGGKKKRK